MYDLVADIDAYQDFLPWCDHSQVLSRDAKEVTASLHIRFGSLNKSFSTQTLYDYVLTKGYQSQPEFQRYLQHRSEELQAKGINVDIWN